MAELGSLGIVVRAAVGKAGGDANAWIDAYVAKDGWFRLDQAQRRLEAWVTNLDDEPEERPLGVVRGVYEDACRAMADGFTKALVASVGLSQRPYIKRTSTARWSRIVEACRVFLRRCHAFRDGCQLRGADSKIAVLSLACRACAPQHHSDRHGRVAAGGIIRFQRYSSGYSVHGLTMNSFQTSSNGRNSPPRAWRDWPTSL